MLAPQKKLSKHDWNLGVIREPNMGVYAKAI